MTEKTDLTRTAGPLSMSDLTESPCIGISNMRNGEEPLLPLSLSTPLFARKTRGEVKYMTCLENISPGYPLDTKTE